MIEQGTIESIKQNVDLASVIESSGITLKKSGKSYKGFCPFHDDTKTPSLSVTPEKGLWQCFGCGAGGDVIDFLRKKEGLSFTEAVARLSGEQNPDTRGRKKPVKEKKRKKETELSPAHYKLLQRVAGFYHTAFTEDPRAMDYLVDRGITNKQLFADFQIGFANGTLLNVLPSDGETITRLKELGILNNRGKEHFYGCATFPLLDSNNNPVGMYGRKLYEFEQKNRNSPRHLYLPGERKGIFNRQGAVNASEIHLTESILDSLSLINNGIQNTIPCYGTNGLTAEIVEHLKINKITTVYLGFDADEAGDAGAAKVKARLEQEGITVFHIRLPYGYDLNNFFHPEVKNPDNYGSYEDLMALAAGLEPAPKKESNEPEYQYQKTDSGFTLTIGERFYEVRGVDKKNNRLKATIKGIANRGGNKKDTKNTKRFHVDTVDFYSARSRSFVIRGLADLFGREDDIISRDMNLLLEHAEQYQPARDTPKEQKEPISDRDKQKALSFLKSPDLLEIIVSDLETIGYTGEEMNKLLCYIAAVSRKMNDPLSVMIQSRSAAGKSCLQDTILSLVPEEDFIKYTRLTDQALFYKDTTSLKHKILAIEELDGMNGAIYSIRTIQSSKKITVAYTGKDAVTGEMKTGENTVEGPVMVFITTTQVDIDGETASRFVFLSIDESREMTEKIMDKQRQGYTMAGMLNRLAAGKIIKKHLAAQRLLKPVLVINPYGDLLSYTSRSLRARRDHVKYLNLIAAITFLFQYQRPKKIMEYEGEKVEYIEVSLDDIAKANEIALEALSRSLDELSPSSRKLLQHIRRFCLETGEQAESESKKSKKFTRRDIREYSGWSDFQVKTHIRQLEDLEYIYSLTGRKGKEYVYELIHDGDEETGRCMIGLADVGEIAKKAAELGISDAAAGEPCHE